MGKSTMRISMTARGTSVKRIHSYGEESFKIYSEGEQVLRKSTAMKKSPSKFTAMASQLQIFLPGYHYSIINPVFRTKGIWFLEKLAREIVGLYSPTQIFPPILPISTSYYSM
jgi:hypothetical protein